MMPPSETRDRPACLAKLSDAERDEVERYIADQTKQLLHSVDRMLDAATHVIGFLPNWLITRLTPKYIDPILAARTAEKLTLKQTIKISNALPIEYLGETAVFLTPKMAADIISGLAHPHASKLIAWLCQHKPSCAITLATELAQRGNTNKLLAAYQFSEATRATLSEPEQQQLEQLLALQK
ncbi:MAG: hypothetical protein P8144_08835 [Gammaproteobacteria bacterium]